MQTAIQSRGEQYKFLAVKVGEQGYGIPIEYIREIIYHTDISKLPEVPDYVCGITLIRQESMPVLDLNILLNRHDKTVIHEESCFIVIQLADAQGNQTHVCLLADEILQSYSVDMECIDAPPLITEKELIHYMVGVGRIDKKLFVLLDPARMISPLLETIEPYTSYKNSRKIKEGSSELPDSSQINIKKSRRTNKFLSVFIHGEEFAFPLSFVAQVLNRNNLTVYQGKDVPDILHGAVLVDNKPTGILHLSTLLSINDSHSTELHAEKPEQADTDKREVIVLIKLREGYIGIAVDRIGESYECDDDMMENSFCTDLPRKRVSTMGFLKKGDNLIEAINPTGIVSEDEKEKIYSWMSCISRLVDTVGVSVNKKSQGENKDHPYQQFAGTYLVIKLGGELIGLRTSVVEEVMSYDEILPLIGGPEWFKGVIDLRGLTYPVIDLARKIDIDIPSEYVDRRNVLVMIKLEEKNIGLMADEIFMTTKISAEQISDTAASNLHVKPETLDAIAKLDTGLVHIINLKNMIEMEDISLKELMQEIREQENGSSTEAPL